MNYGMFTKEDLYGSQGLPRTKSLFKEWAGEGAPLCLSKHEIDGCINLRSLYISFCVDDPTEVEFAEAVFGDWEYWSHLSSISWMKAELDKWREVAAVKRKAKAFTTLIRDASDSKSRTKTTSAKYLIEESWRNKKSPVVKKDVEKTTELAYDRIKEDAERVFQ